MPAKLYVGSEIKAKIGGVRVSIMVNHPPSPQKTSVSITADEPWTLYSMEPIEDHSKAHGLGIPEPENPCRGHREQEYSPF